MKITNSVNELIANHSYDELNLTLNKENMDSAGRNDQTPLIYAVSQNDSIAAKIIMERGADVNRVDADGFAALYYAIINDNADIAENLLRRGANVNLKFTLDEEKINYLVLSTMRKNTGMSKLLLSHNIYINYTFRLKPNDRIYGYFNALFIAVAQDDQAHVKLLTDHKINTDYEFKYGKYSRFNIFALSLLMGNMDTIRRIFERSKNKFNKIQYADHDDPKHVIEIANITVLEVLAIEGCSNAGVYKYLFENGADFNGVSTYKEGAQSINCGMFFIYIIFLAGDGVNEELINLFISKGLDLKQRFKYEKDGETAYNYIEMANLLGKYKLCDHLQAVTK